MRAYDIAGAVAGSIFGTLSMVSSGAVLSVIVHRGGRKRVYPLFEQLVLGLAVSTVFTSFFYSVQPWMVVYNGPENGPFCLLLKFCFSSIISAYLYTAGCVAYCYCFAMKTENTSMRYPSSLPYIIHIVPWSLVIAAVVLNMFGAPGPELLAGFPCTEVPGLVSLGVENSKTAHFALIVEAIMVLCPSAGLMFVVSIAMHLEREQNYLPGFILTAAEWRALFEWRRKRAIAFQILSYTTGLIASLTSTVLGSLFVTHNCGLPFVYRDQTQNLVSALLYVGLCALTPSLGMINAVVYFYPRFVRWNATKPERSYWWSLWMATRRLDDPPVTLRTAHLCCPVDSSDILEEEEEEETHCAMSINIREADRCTANSRLDSNTLRRGTSNRVEEVSQGLRPARYDNEHPAEEDETHGLSISLLDSGSSYRPDNSDLYQWGASIRAEDEATQGRFEINEPSSTISASIYTDGSETHATETLVGHEFNQRGDSEQGTGVSHGGLLRRSVSMEISEEVASRESSLFDGETSMSAVSIGLNFSYIGE